MIDLSKFAIFDESQVPERDPNDQRKLFPTPRSFIEQYEQSGVTDIESLGKAYSSAYKDYAKDIGLPKIEREANARVIQSQFFDGQADPQSFYQNYQRLTMTATDPQQADNARLAEKNKETDGMFSSFVHGVGGAIGGTVSGISDIGHSLDTKLGTLGRFRGDILPSYLEPEEVQFLQKRFPAMMGLEGDVITAVGEGIKDFTKTDNPSAIPAAIGSATGTLLTTAAGGLAGLGAKGAVALGIAQSATQLANEGKEDYLQEMRQQGFELNPEQLANTTLLNSALASADLFPGGRLAKSMGLSGLDAATGGWIKKALIGTGIGAGSEGITEVAQTIASNWIAQGIVEYDKDRDLWQGTRDAAIGGASAGAFMNAIAHMIGGRRARGISDTDGSPETLTEDSPKTTQEPSSTPSHNPLSEYAKQRAGREVESVNQEISQAAHPDTGTHLGDLIASGEGGYGSFNRGVAGDAGGAEIDFSDMTVAELMQKQALPEGDKNRIFAFGKYQIVPDTMREAVAALKIDPNAKVTPELQERIFSSFLLRGKRPDIEGYITGRHDDLKRAQIAGAREWASIARPDTGKSHYDGDAGGNAASISAERFGEGLQAARKAYQEAVASGKSQQEAWAAAIGTPIHTSSAHRLIGTPSPHPDDIYYVNSRGRTQYANANIPRQFGGSGFEQSFPPPTSDHDEITVHINHGYQPTASQSQEDVKPHAYDDDADQNDIIDVPSSKADNQPKAIPIRRFTPIESLINREVRYGDNQGFLVSREDGIYVVEQDNDILVEGGFSGRSAEELGLTAIQSSEIDIPEKATLTTDWGTNTIYVYGKQFQYEGTLSDDNGFTIGIRVIDHDGKQRTIKNKELVNTIEAEKIAHELDNRTKNEERAIRSLSPRLEAVKHVNRRGAERNADSETGAGNSPGTEQQSDGKKFGEQQQKTVENHTRLFGFTAADIANAMQSWKRDNPDSTAEQQHPIPDEVRRFLSGEPLENFAQDFINPLADGERNGRGGAVNEGRSGYSINEEVVASPNQLSLFYGNEKSKVPDTGRGSDAGGRAIASRPQADRIVKQANSASLPGQFATKTKLIPGQKYKIARNRIDSAEDAAIVFDNLLGNRAREALDVIVVGKDGDILALQRMSTGTIDTSNVYPGDIIRFITSIPDAVSFYTGHNHPSGVEAFSTADHHITRQIAEYTENLSFEYSGMFAIGDSNYSFMKEADLDDVYPLPKPEKKHEVELLEHVIEERGRLLDEAVSNPDDALSVVNQVSEGRDGIVLMDNRHYPTAFIPVDFSKAKKLAGTKEANRILASVTRANAAAAIIKTSGEQEYALNVSALLDKADIRVLDVLQGTQSLERSGVSTKRHHSSLFNIRSLDQSIDSIAAESSLSALQEDALTEVFGSRPKNQKIIDRKLREYFQSRYTESSESSDVRAFVTEQMRQLRQSGALKKLSEAYFKNQLSFGLNDGIARHPIPAEKAEAAIRRVLGDIPFESTIPDTVRTQAGDAASRVKGAFANGKIYIDTRNIASVAEAEAIAVEELTHRGVANLFGKEYDQRLTDLYDAMGGEKGIRRFVNKHNIDMADDYFSQSPIAQMDELLAHIEANSDTLTVRVKRAFQRLIGLLRKNIRRLNTRVLHNVSDSDIVLLARRARQAAGQQQPLVAAQTKNTRFHLASKEAAKQHEMTAIAAMSGQRIQRARNLQRYLNSDRVQTWQDRYAAIKRTIYGDADQWTAIRKWTARHLGANSTLGRAIADARRGVDWSRVAVHDSVISDIVALEFTIQNIYKKHSADLTRKEQDQFHKALTGKFHYGSAKLQAQVDIFRARIDKASKELISEKYAEMKMRIDELNNDGIAALEKIANQLIDGEKDVKVPPQLVQIANLQRQIHTIEGNLGKYVTRAYQAFYDPKWVDKVRKKPVYKEAIKFLQQDHARQINERINQRIAKHQQRITEISSQKKLTKAEQDSINKHNQAITTLRAEQATVNNGKHDDLLSQEEARGKLNKWLESTRGHDSMVTFSVLQGTNEGIMKHRKDIPPVLREVLGEYTDPIYNYANSLVQTGEYIARQRYQIQLRKLLLAMPDIAHIGQHPESERFVQFPDSPAYSALHDLWIDRDFMADLKEFGSLKPLMDNPLYRTLVSTAAAVKLGKTVGAPTTQMRNFWSGFLLLAASGHSPFGNFLDTFNTMKNARNRVGIWSGELKLNNQQAAELNQKYVRLGVRGDGSNAGELARIFSDFHNMSNEVKEQGLVGKGWSVLLRTYQFSDDFFKIIAFEKEAADLQKAGMSRDAAEEEAARRVRDTMPTYSMVSHTIQQLRQFPLMGPFVAFPFEMFRTLGNNIRYMAADWQRGKSNPVYRKMAYKRALGLFTAYILPSIVSQLSMWLTGVDNEDDDALDYFSSNWRKGQLRLYIGNGETGMRYVDLTSLVPSEFVIRAIREGLQEGAKADNIFSAMGSGITQTLINAGQPFYSMDIATQGFVDIYKNNNRYDRPIYGDGKTLSDLINHPVENAQHIDELAGYIASQFGPGVVQNIKDFGRALAGTVGNDEGMLDIINEYAAGIGGNVSRSGKQATGWDAFLALAGFRVTTQDMKTLGLSASGQTRSQIASYSAEFKQALDTTVTLSPEFIDNQLEQLLADRQRAYRKMAHLIGYYRRKHWTNAQIQQALYERNRTLGKNVVAELLRDKIPIYEPSKELLSKSLSATQRIPDPAARFRAKQALSKRYRYVVQRARELQQEN